MSRPPLVVVAEPLAEEGIRVLCDGGADVVNAVGFDRARLKIVLTDGQALVVRSKVRVDEDLLETAQSLRAVGRAGVGVDGIDVTAASRRGIVVLNTPDASTIAAAEHTFALMLALCRNVTRAHQRVVQHQWNAGGLTGVELAGKTLGIIGLGRIGSAVATRARSFGMQVVAHDAFASDARIETLGAKPASLHELLRTADIVSLHAPLTPQNRGLIDRDELRMMRAGARIVNCARGGLIDEAALLEALDSGDVAGAALDVVSDEPPPADSLTWRLLAHPAVVATPHLGGATREAQARIAVDLCKDIMAVLAGRPPSAAVNAPVAADAQTRPFIELAYILGRTYPQIAADVQPRIALVLEGELRVLDPRPFTVGLLVGLLPQISERRVSAVNAEQVAQEMGIVVETLSGPCDRGFSRALSLRGGRTTLAGTVIHGEQQRLIEVDGFEVDLAPHGPVLMTRHQDVPGIVGRVGTILGTAEINIANMQVARSDAGGAIMLMGLERAPSADVLTQLRDIPHVESVRAIHL